MPLDEELRAATIDAIQQAQRKIEWRPGKDVQHLTKRIRFRHLAVGTTLAEYEAIILQVVRDRRAKVYLFHYRGKWYPTLVSTSDSRVWLVMIGLDGVMETAFPPSEPDTYLSDPAYLYVSVLEELLR